MLPHAHGTSAKEISLSNLAGARAERRDAPWVPDVLIEFTHRWEGAEEHAGEPRNDEGVFWLHP